MRGVIIAVCLRTEFGHILRDGVILFTPVEGGRCFSPVASKRVRFWGDIRRHNVELTEVAEAHGIQN